MPEIVVARGPRARGVSGHTGVSCPPAASPEGASMQLERGDGRAASAADTARGGSGLATVYHALDDVIARFALRDAALVVDVPPLGRQVLHAGRRPMHNDLQGLHAAEPGLYLDPPVDVPV